MADNHLISVVIPVYNMDKFLSRCLTSVLHQTMKDIEVICINDGSTDQSGDILQTFSAADKRLIIINQTNKGLSAARNAGIKRASGQFIFFLDADDYLHPQALEIFYKVAVKSKSPVIISQSVCRLGKDKIPNKTYDPDAIKYKICSTPLQDLYKYRLVSAVVWNKLYRTDIVKNFCFIDGIYFEDWPFTACLFSEIDNFALIKEKLYMYNTISPSIVRSDFSVRKIHDYIFGIHHVHDYFLQHNKTDAWKIVRRKRISATIRMLLSKIKKSRQNKNELEKYFKEEYQKLVQQKLIFFGDLSLKSKIRLVRLLWRQRKSS